MGSGLLTRPGLSGPINNSGGPWGWEFQVGDKDINVAALSVIAPDNSTRNLKLYDAATYVVLRTVSVVTISGTVVKGVIAPITLTSGKKYIAAVDTNYWYYISVNGLCTFDPRITFIRSKYGATMANSDGAQIYGMADIVFEDAQYHPSGSYVTLPIDLSVLENKLRLQASVTTPAGTAISFSTAVSDDPTTWVEQTVGELISNIPAGDLVGKTLQVKANLSTTIVQVTPSLSSLYLEEEVASRTRLLLKLVKRLGNPQGQISIAYNPGVGNLTGEQGSSVLDFSQAFTPVFLEVPLFNPNIIERVQVSASVSATLLEVYVTDAQLITERIQLSVAVTGTLTDVSILP